MAKNLVARQVIEAIACLSGDLRLVVSSQQFVVVEGGDTFKVTVERTS